MTPVTLNGLLTPGLPVAVLFCGDHLPFHATERAAATRQPELNLAIAEAQAYAQGTRQAAEAVRRIPAR